MNELLQLTDEQKQILQSLAARCKGIKYVFGQKVSDMAMQPEQIKGIDCSGYVRYLFNKIGIHINDGSFEQFSDSSPTDSPEVGDLVFKRENGNIAHVGIIISVLPNQILVTEAAGSLGMVVIRDFEDFKVHPTYAQYAGVQRLIADKVKLI